ncbi:nicotinate phosphoribosyltransferase [Picrophilus oshimae]|uniref:Nicotinate phosphoribosyltransferase n=1 Tax=Picrophilus torridus (strain ATCC 700027 / DSM 9790 / JCM 10055 / NBRC 100828 / KAW 2/3) TaxID=1122961 RepID=Q6L0B3_PICTO|nr:nicotinate phosphoribosyltransferase [Picrophilus oshimae]AAT43589.1 nicotinate phosphoribosyltransferase [Picrophilus oshimae DSM 9789]
MRFAIASEDDILNGKTADIYFERTIEDLKLNGKNPEVYAEVTVSSTKYKYINFTGLNDVLNLLRDKKIDVYAIPEGTLIKNRDEKGVPVPFLIIHGRYLDFAIYETALLGFLCQASGISSYSSMIYKVLGDIPFYSFGIRRMNPAISPMIDRSAYIGGASGVSGILGASLIGIKPVGTMPHALSIILGDDAAWESVYKNSDVKTILIDTFMDEKFAAIKAAEKFPGLDYIRLDTPASRRGNFKNIVRELRWELNIRGYNNIKIMASGGLKLEDLKDLVDAGVSAFGIGTSIASAEPVDFSLDIVNVEGTNITKRGKFSGIKDVYKCNDCGNIYVLPINSNDRCECGGELKSIMIKYMDSGNVIFNDDIESIRSRSIEAIKRLDIL